MNLLKKENLNPTDSMPLTCTQRNTPLRQEDGAFFIAGRFNDSSILELSRMAIDYIPSHLRRAKTCEDLKDYLGVDIYVGAGVPSDDGYFQDNGLSVGKFVFSIDRNTVNKHLNQIAIVFPERFPPKRRAI